MAPGWYLISWRQRRLQTLVVTQRIEALGGSVAYEGLAGQLAKSTDLGSNVLYVNLDHAKMSAADVEMLTTLRSVAMLSANYSSLTDTDIRQLCGALDLTDLYLDGCTISDQSLPALLEERSLEVLRLSETHVSPGGVRSLCKLPRLKKLYCRGIPIHAKDIEALKATYPNLELIVGLE